MERKDFIKYSSFAILALGVAPTANLLANTSAESNLYINSLSHIRHGLLPQLNANLFSNFPVVFQLNEFKDGININRGNANIKVLSILSNCGIQQNLQLSFDGKIITIVDENGTSEIGIDASKSKRFAIDDKKELHLLYGDQGQKFQIKNTDKSYLMCFQGSADVNRQNISEKKGIEIKAKKLNLELNENNSLVILVKLT